MDEATYFIKTAEVQTSYEQDEAKIAKWEQAGLYTVQEITEFLQNLKEMRDWLMDKLADDFWKGFEGDHYNGDRFLEWCDSFLPW